MSPRSSKLIERPDDNLVLNCGYGDGLSVLQVLDAVDRANGDAGRAADGGAQGRRRAGAGGRRTRALLETLDWRPEHADIDAIVRDALAWERRLLEHAG